MAYSSLRSDDSTEVDDRPLSVRRKRRCSTALVDPVHQPKIEQIDESGGIEPEPAKTPSKPKKKVRFSDPGPEITGPPLSTGLTPALSRTSFDAFRPQPIPRSLSQVRQRMSLPNLRANPLPSPSSLSPLEPLSGEIQFAPLCQKLDDRVKRRLRRNNLSTEQEVIEQGKKAEKKSLSECIQEIQHLKAEMSSIKKQQLHGEADGVSNASRGAGREKELEAEIVQLKQEIQDREMSAIPSAPEHSVEEPLTPNSIISLDDDAEGVLGASVTDDSGLEDQATTVTPPQYCEASTQALIQHPRESEVLRSARLSLEYLFPGEIALGLVPDDPKPLFDVMLERLQTFRTRTLIAEDALSTTRDQEANLRTQFNAVLEQLERARRYAEKVGNKHTNEKTRADAAQGKVEALEESLRDASVRVQGLESSVDEKERSTRRLHGALESYRTEVGKLEMLITDLERDHNTAMTKLRSDMDEAVADLECHVTAETVGRRAAESEVEKRDEKIKELRVKEAELIAAVNEKQQILRDIEQAIDGERKNRDQEVGALKHEAGALKHEAGALKHEADAYKHEVSSLKTELSQLRHNARASDRRYEQADQERELIIHKLEQEKHAATRSIAAMQEELAQCSKNAQGIRDAYVSDCRKRSAAAVEHKGLLTPTTGGRFRDADEIEGMEGFVDVQRGKKAKRKQRPDSGVVILEEDGDEDEDENKDTEMYHF